jgi:hypothetical protein
VKSCERFFWFILFALKNSGILRYGLKLLIAGRLMASKILGRRWHPWRENWKAGGGIRDEEKKDPWGPAQEALFNVVRAWVKEENEGDPQKTAEECLKIMKEVNQTEGAPFIFVCELARVLAECIARHLADLHGELPSREEVMHEIDIMELEYIEESVISEQESDEESK